MVVMIALIVECVGRTVIKDKSFATTPVVIVVVGKRKGSKGGEGLRSSLVFSKRKEASSVPRLS